VVTSNGVLYRFGNVNQGFDNDGDYQPDYDAWAQPVGEPSYDPSCFRLIRTTGVLTISRSSGLPDQLYFTNLPSNNTGVVGEVHYVFLALNGPCSTSWSPYQEVASGFDNEKFNADFGAGIPPVGSSEPEVTIDKSSSPNVVALGSTTTYQIPFQNTSSSVFAGVVSDDWGVYSPLVISDSIPSGTEYVTGSADYTLSGIGVEIL